MNLIRAILLFMLLESVFNHKGIADALIIIAVAIFSEWIDIVRDEGDDDDE